MRNEFTASSPISFGTQFRATRAVVARSRVSLVIYGFFVGVPLLALAVLLTTGCDLARPSVFGLPIWVELLFGPAFVFLFLPLCHALNVWQMRRGNASIRGVLTFTITSEGFESHGGSFDLRIRWDAIHRVVETKHFLLFYIAAARAYFIPKTCMASPEDLQTVRKIIRDAIGRGQSYGRPDDKRKSKAKSTN